VQPRLALQLGEVSPSVRLTGLASRLQKQKARFNSDMVPCNSIGYFTPSAM
jgi:hypothetical protein